MIQGKRGAFPRYLDSSVIAMHASGMTALEMERRLGVSARTIEGQFKRLKLKRGPKQAAPKFTWFWRVDARLAELVASGASDAEIAAKLGATAAQVAARIALKSLRFVEPLPAWLDRDLEPLPPGHPIALAVLRDAGLAI